MKKVLIFLGIILVASAIIIGLNKYQTSQKLANNPYPTDDLHNETIELLDDPNYQNIITPEELEQSLANGGTETIYFFSPTCIYCVESTPIVVSLAEEYGVDLKLFNTLEYGKEAAPYNIKGTPTFVRYENGQEVSRIVGSYPEEEFREWFETFAE